MPQTYDDEYEKTTSFNFITAMHCRDFMGGDLHFKLSHNGDAGNKKTIVYAKLAFGDNGSRTNYTSWSGQHARQTSS